MENNFTKGRIEFAADIILTIKGGEFKEFWETLGPDGRKLYHEAVAYLKEQYYQKKKYKR